MKKYEEYLNKAHDSFEKGFTSKAAKNKANSFLLLAYEQVINSLREKILLDRSESDSRFDELTEIYYQVPQFHHWKEKHNELFSDYKSHTSYISDLVELRKAIKESEIIKIERESNHQEEIVRKTITEEIAKRKEQFVEGLRLAHLFNGLNVCVNAHYVTNQHGTQFVRHFFYLNGKLTPLTMLIAIAQTYQKEKK